MKIIIKTKNVELSGALQSFIDEKIGSLKKFITVFQESAPEKGKTLSEVFVEVEQETHHHHKGNVFICQLNVVLPGKTLSAECSSEDLYKSIIGAKKELEEEIKKHNVKKVELDRREQRKTKREIIR